MESELTNLLDLDVYTSNGRFVGTTEDIILNVDEKNASKIAIKNLNTIYSDQLEGSEGILLPYRWVLAVEDIMLIKRIPEDLNLEEDEEEKEEGGEVERKKLFE